MKNTLTINDVGKIIYFKNQEIRTPVIIEVTEKELQQIKISLKMLNIRDYSIKIKTEEPKIEYINKKIIIEELNINNKESNKESNKEDPKSILNKLINKEL